MWEYYIILRITPVVLIEATVCSIRYLNFQKNRFDFSVTYAKYVYYYYYYRLIILEMYKRKDYAVPQGNNFIASDEEAKSTGPSSKKRKEHL